MAGVVLTFVFLLAGVVLMLSALITSVRRRAPDAIRSCLWGSLGCIIVITGTALVYFFVVALDDPSFTLDFAGPFQAYLVVVTVQFSEIQGMRFRLQ